MDDIITWADIEVTSRPAPNYTVSCTVCGHIAAHPIDSRITDDRRCTGCGYCARLIVDLDDDGFDWPLYEEGDPEPDPVEVWSCDRYEPIGTP